MPHHPATAAVFHLVGDLYPLATGSDADRQNRYLHFAALKAVRDQMPLTVTIDPPYNLDIYSATSWLPKVERRIQASTLPNEYVVTLGEGDVEKGTEWLSEDVAHASLSFFERCADVLPGEPHLYASKGGALVAEFEAKNGSLTTVISPESVILFAVTAENPESPIELTLVDQI